MTELDGGSWRGRRVFITGHSGFVGSWLSVALLSLGARVVGYADSADSAAAERARWLADLGVRQIVGDIRDLISVHRAMTSDSFDTVIHLAAQPLVSVGHADPYQTMQINIGGSMAVLEAARQARVPVLLHVTSDKCYRNKGWRWPYRENDELGGGCPYSVSKAASEVVFEGYAGLLEELGATRSVSIRFGNVIGGGDFATNRLVPDCLRALADGRPISLRQPAAVRPFQHVLDVVQGLLRADAALRSGALPPGDVLNFSPPGTGAPVGALAAALAKAWGAATPDATTASGSAFPEDQQLLLDGRKAAALLHWRHEFDLDDSAESIVRWHREYLRGTSAARCTRDDVDAFLARVAMAGR